MRAYEGRIWEATSKDQSRPVLTFVYFDAEKGTLSASDSYIAARVPCQVEDGDESGLIPAEALKVAAGESLRVADGKATLSLGNGARVWNLGDGQFPDLDKAVFTNGLKPRVVFGLNGKFLARLQEALGSSNGVRLAVSRPRRAVLASTSGGLGQGAIMPVVVNDEEPIGESADAVLANDDAVVAAVRVAAGQLKRKQGKARVAEAFREALKQAAS